MCKKGRDILRDLKKISGLEGIFKLSDYGLQQAGAVADALMFVDDPKRKMTMRLSSYRTVPNGDIELHEKFEATLRFHRVVSPGRPLEISEYSEEGVLLGYHHLIFTLTPFGPTINDVFVPFSAEGKEQKPLVGPLRPSAPSPK